MALFLTSGARHPEVHCFSISLPTLDLQIIERIATSGHTSLFKRRRALIDEDIIGHNICRTQSRRAGTTNKERETFHYGIAPSQ